MAFKGRRLLVIILSSVLCVGLAYIAFEPLPDGITQPYIVKTRLAIYNVARTSCMLAERFGYDGLHAFKTAAGILLRPVLFFQSPSPVYNVTHEDNIFDGVPVRVYTPTEDLIPKGQQHLGKRAIVYFHGGGWVMGSVAMYDRLIKKLSQALDAVIVSVEYRLAPKHKFPAAIDDCFVAAKYFLQRSKQFGVDNARISIMGDSAGGNLAAAVTQRLKDELFRPLPKMQILMYPALQATDFRTASMTWNANGPLLTRSFMVWFYGYYIFGHQEFFNLMMTNNHTHPHVKQNMPLKYMKPDHLPVDEMIQNFIPPTGRQYGNVEFWEYYKPTFMNPYLAPLMTRTEDIAGLPHTYIVSCQYDVLRDDAFHYAARLRKENVTVEHVNLRECYHGWFNEYETRVVDSFRNNFKTIINYIDEHL